ncbi:bifunctional 2-methylcitrate synthase/citrate synthase [Rhodothermus bifroesti]|uniref:Citrate synthase n=1 Tax=Rhodothermus marinus TaxID=29549 RepID=A0A7V2B2A7_RHOMR|nr:bifunctional 2-methylcitrate synthase/citrate synthase [Rhodothermus bifroesti]GBD01879.1 2-methylcitrate synthase [bacterium HR18]
MAETPEVRKGLEGVIADESAISNVIPEKRALYYRGYPVHALAEQCRFEEVAYLLLYGELPTQAQLEAFAQEERRQRNLDASVRHLLALIRSDAAPMDVLRTAVSLIGANDPDASSTDLEAIRRKSIGLLAKLPTIVAADRRRRQGLNIIPPREDLTFAENFFHMYFGEVPSAEVIKAFDVSLILYAEHSFNASTFAARVIVSTLSDYYSAITGAIGALKGPLHGGANEAVMRMLQRFRSAEEARRWAEDALARKEKIMGFGHRVYRYGDSRVPIMERYTRQLAERLGHRELMAIYDALQEVVVQQKGIYPNLDYPTGPAYYMMGFDIETYTPIFVMSRVAGWSAHVIEQLAHNRIIRPLSRYVGPAERSVLPLEARR